MDDSSLLQKYCDDRDQDAFGSLVERYLGMVYGVILRRTGSPPLSEELTQNVFAVLARKAPELESGVVLSGWLHRAAVFESARANRKESNRNRIMKEFSELLPDREVVDPQVWNDTLPILDEAIDELEAGDREVVLMRFVEDRSLREIGAETGRSESAAQRHVQRALEKLSALLRRRGVTASTAALAAAIVPELARSAPAGLSAMSVAKAALPAATGAGVATTAALIMTRTTTLIIAGTLLAAASTTGGVLLGKRNARLAGEAANMAGATGGGGAVDRAAPPRVDAEVSRAGVEDEMSPFRRIMRQLVRLSTEGDLPDVRGEMRDLARGLGAGEMEDALGFLDGAGEGGAVLAEILFERWGEVDVGAARDALAGVAAEWRRHGALGLASSWAKSDFGAAEDWYLAEEESGALGQVTLQGVAERLFAGSLASEPGAALAFFESLGFDTQRVAIEAVEGYGADRELAGGVAEVIAGISDSHLQLEVVEGFGSRWARHADVATVTGWFDSMGFPSDPRVFESALEIGEAFMEAQPAVALDWLWPKASDEEKEALLEFVGGYWIGKDRAAAEAWLEGRRVPAEIGGQR